MEVGSENPTMYSLLIMISRDLTTDLAPQQPMDKSDEFDYNTLSTEAQNVLQQQILVLKQNLQEIVARNWSNGRMLFEIRSSLKLPRFKAWLDAEFPRSRFTANNQINVYVAFAEDLTLTHLPIDESALYRLAAPSTPVAAREEAITRAKAGEIISLQTANRIIGTKKISKKKQKNVDRDTELCAATDVTVVATVVSPPEPELLPESFVTQKPVDEEETIDVAAISQEDQLVTDFEPKPPCYAADFMSEDLVSSSASEEMPDSTESMPDSTFPSSTAASSQTSERAFNSDSSFKMGQSVAAFTPNSNNSAIAGSPPAYSAYQTIVSNLDRLSEREAHSILRAFLQKLGITAISNFVKELKQEEIATLCNQCLGFLNERGLKWLEIERINFAALSDTDVDSIKSHLKQIFVSRGKQKLAQNRTQSNEPSNLICINAIG